MIVCNIFNVIKDTDEIRTIDNIYYVTDEENSDLIENIIFKINDKLWIIGVDHEFDEIELLIKPNLNIYFMHRQILSTLSHLKGLEIGNMSAIVNERGYTNGIKLRIHDPSPSRQGTNPFYGMLTIVAASNLKYEITHTGIESYLV